MVKVIVTITLPSRLSSRPSKQNLSGGILGRHGARQRWPSSNTSMGSITRVVVTQHWAGKAPLSWFASKPLPGSGTLSNGRWLKRAPGAAQKRDRSRSKRNACISIRFFGHNEVIKTTEIALVSTIHPGIFVNLVLLSISSNCSSDK